MAKINLLPWREARREQQKKEFLTGLGVTVFAAILTVFLVHTFVQGMIDDQNRRNAYMQKKIDELNEQVKEISELKKKREQLIERMKIIQNLQGNRPVIVRIFDELVRTIPDGVYYTKLSRTGSVIEIEGTAESNNRVSSLMRKLDASEWFNDPNLTAVTANPAFGEQANDFKLSVALATPKLEVEEEK